MTIVAQSLTIIGAGAWGEALGLTLARAGHNVTLWGRNSAKITALQTSPLWHTCPTLQGTCSLEAALDSAHTLVFALPAQTFRAFFSAHPPLVPVVVASKGIELSTGALLSEVARDMGLAVPLGFLGGPHLAGEVRQGLPTAGTLASVHKDFGEKTAATFQHPGFKLTFCADAVGVQVVGALKNVLAIAGGLVMGASGGENARAALLTQGLQEMGLFAQALGAFKETLWTQAGIGDVMLSCLSPHARNARFGLAWGRGETPDPLNPLAEGFFTVQAVHKRAQSLGLTLPLLTTLKDLLHEKATPLSPSSLLTLLMESVA